MLRPLLTVTSGLVLATGLSAQAPAKLDLPSPSPSATVKQRIGVTDVEVEYSRPSARGRKIFGGLEPYGSVWRTGANTATKISFSTAVKLNGTDIPAGTYELFTIPGESDWTVIVHQNKSQWGAYEYDAANDVARVKAHAQSLTTPVETFTISFDNLADEASGTMNLSWEKTRVPVKIETDVVATVVPKIDAAMSGEGKKPYFGAAMFYYENNLDLKKALEWIDAGLAANPDAFYMVYRKGLILEKMGDKAGAKAAAEKSLAMSEQQKGAIRDEYVRLNKALIARVQ